MAVEPYFDLPPGPQLAWRNRRLAAEREAWPAEALEACERIERTHPGWSPSWRTPNTIKGWEAPAGFYARPAGTLRGGYSYGADAAALVRTIEARSSRCQRCGTVVPVPAAATTPLHQADADGDWCLSRSYLTTVNLRWSHCPRCMAWFEFPRGSEVPPHRAPDGTGWCPTRCSQRTG